MPLTLTRSLLVVLIPGLIALAPWLLWLLGDHENSEVYYRKYPELVWGALFAMSAVVGSLLEGINSQIEVYWDNRKTRRGQPIREDWYDYLARPCPTEPVGHGYLSRMVTTMYFELAMAWATLSCGVGVSTLFDMSCGYSVLTIAIAFVVSVGLLLSAKDSHQVLCEARREINKRLGPVKHL